MSDKPTIAAYLAGYDPQLLGRPLQPAERMLVEEVLLDFMLDEPMLGHVTPVARIRAGLARLRMLVAPDQHSLADRLIQAIEQEAAQLAGRLARQEHVNLLMREQLAIMSSPRAQGKLTGRASNCVR